MLSDFKQVVFASDVGETVNNPGCLMITAVSVRVRSVGSVALLRGVDNRNVMFVDGTEHVLTPGDEIAPYADVIMEVGQALPPSLKDELQVS